MSLRLLLTLSGGLEILAGLPALISPAPVVSLLLGVPVGQLAAVLARFFGAEVFALGLACLKARDDVGSAADLAVSVGITSYKYAGSRGNYLDCNRVGTGRLVVVRSRDCPCGFWRVILVRPRGDETTTERSVGRSIRLRV